MLQPETQTLLVCVICSYTDSLYYTLHLTPILLMYEQRSQQLLVENEPANR